MKNFLEDLKDLDTIELNGKIYIPYKSVVEMYSKPDSGEVEVMESYPSLLQMVQKLVSLKTFYIALILLVLLLSSSVGILFGYKITYPVSLFEFLKIVFVVISTFIVKELANFYYKDSTDYDHNVPSPKRIVRDLTKGFLFYVSLSSFLFMISVNFEALGIEILKDILAVYLTLICFLSISIIILDKWFNPIYNFLVGTKENETDFPSGWEGLNYKDQLQSTILITALIIISCVLLFGYFSAL